MDTSTTIRSASHSGSWYSSSKSELSSQLQNFFNSSDNFFLQNSKEPYMINKILKSIIVPHAGYRFSGPTAGWGYINIDKTLFKRVVIIGPSHHSYFEGCGLSKFSFIETPIGNLKIDQKSTEMLKSKIHFQEIDFDVDEEEHSLEMQFPFLKYIFGDSDVEILPIMIGDIDFQMQEKIAECLMEFYKDKDTLFIVSSDFCHWGKRFRFTFYDKSFGKIFESIQMLDRMGMDSIESMDPNIFSEYLADYKNTICGRKPISILLSILNKFNLENNLNIKKEGFEKNQNFIKFVKYNQSSKVIEENDSSVSYAVGLNYVDKIYLI